VVRYYFGIKYGREMKSAKTREGDKGRRGIIIGRNHVITIE